MRGLRSIAVLGGLAGQASAEATDVYVVEDEHGEFVAPPHFDRPVSADMTARQERQMNKTRRKKKKAFRP